MSFWDGTRWVEETSPAPSRTMRRARHLLGATAEAGLITALIFGLIASSAFAAKGGNAHTAGGGASLAFQSATGTFAEGSQYTVVASGFPANTWVTVGAHYDTTYWGSAVTDGSGTARITFTAFFGGQIYHEAYQQGNNSRMRFVTSATLTVTTAP